MDNALHVLRILAATQTLTARGLDLAWGRVLVVVGRLHVVEVAAGGEVAERSGPAERRLFASHPSAFTTPV
eukprot:15480213-Alexandrium_andersonii.AAC.1